MKPESKASNSKGKNTQQMALVPVFNVLAIQKEIILNIEPFFRQQALLHQFFQQQAGAMQNLARHMNNAVETYRRAFEVFGNLQEQIRMAQKERERIVLSVSQIVDSWNHFIPHIPTAEDIVSVSQPTRPQTREVVLHQDDLIETITNRVIEKVEERAKEKTLKLLAGMAIVSLPSDARWESITFAFLDDSNAEIRHGRKLIGRYNREKLKFVKTNTKDKKPNNAWWLLLMLSTFQDTNDVRPTIDELLKSERFKKMERNTLHATKSMLSNHLSLLLGIGDDPFYNYSECGYYRPKFNLLPPIGLRGNDVYITKKKKGFQEDPQLEEDLY